jgi:hypothetical protein
MAYKNIMDIINFIKVLAPHIETDEFVESLLFVPKNVENKDEGDKSV